MATGKKEPARTKGKTTLAVSTDDRPEFTHSLMAFVFDRSDTLLDTALVRDGKVTLRLSEEELAKASLFLLPTTDDLPGSVVTPARLERLGAFRPVLREALTDALMKIIEIPGPVLDLWPYCQCLVKGRVIRASDGRNVCNARVHICEVDQLPIWIAKLPEPDLLRLRDDLLDVVLNPKDPFPPDPIPDPPGPWPDPEPTPAPFGRSLIRIDPKVMGGEMAGSYAVPRSASITSPISASVLAWLTSSSPTIVRAAMVENWKLVLPYLCLWPWWWRLRCDEVGVVTTDPFGRFQWVMTYPCFGDHPDLYFWVEYDFGGGFETVYRPPMACWTNWDYPCGQEITLRVQDPRVPACNGEGSPTGKEVWVISVGRKVSVGEIHTDAAGSLEGMVREPFRSGEQEYAFGGKLEPRVWFGRADLIAGGITHYLWSARPLGGDEADWRPLNRQVIRHYTTGAGTAPVDVLGPEAGGANDGRFRIRPVSPPPGGIEWLVADEREDLATAHFVTRAPEAPDPLPVCGVPDPDAGKYELKLELFDSAGNRVVWNDEGVVLRIGTGEAPYGTNPVTTQVAGSYHRIQESGKTVGFRMVIHVDNSRCGADIAPIAGAGISVNPDCGVATLVGGAPTLDVAFQAGRPGGLARFDFDTERGLSHDIAQASADGGVADPMVDGFARSAPCSFTKPTIPAATFLGTCDQAAFSEHLRVWALSQDGYARLHRLDAYDVAAFMLTEPCPPLGVE